MNLTATAAIVLFASTEPHSAHLLEKRRRAVSCRQTNVHQWRVAY